MALFSRRPKKPAEQPPTSPQPSPADEVAGDTVGAPVEAAPAEQSAGDAPARETDAAAEPTQEGPAPDAPGHATEADAAASVSISVSSFGGLGVSPATSQRAEPREPQAGEAVPPGPKPRVGAREWMRTAPEPAETVPGLRDNVLLRAALGRIGDAPASQALLDVTRQLLQGHVFLRVKGDARALLAEGKGLPLAIANSGDRTFALVYSSGAALQASVKADGDTETSAMGQPVLTVLRHVFASSYDGIIIDPASSPSRAVLPKELLQRAVEQADPQLTVKTLLAAERTSEITAKVAEALTRVPLWVAVGVSDTGAPGIAEGRDADGRRFLEVYSHPLEVAVMGRGDNAGPITPAQLAKALRTDEGLTGLLVDPAGPWIRLSRDDLAPLLALAD
ncbi:SseB family protein [Microbacterium ureisolvens]|uniref:SseB family protein n=1 Tax=Microbacterium ureisolvens TaxID=2781186 RepID=A0ABS7HYX4_9MICO|nr:SseB family protein [Microbacterium ureisolvens]MBW9110592.1 SseB family protein [Microbacterium ureisolvens]